MAPTVDVDPALTNIKQDDDLLDHGRGHSSNNDDTVSKTIWTRLRHHHEQHSYRVLQLLYFSLYRLLFLYI